MIGKIFSRIFRALVKGCVVFTAMTVLLYVGALILNGNRDVLSFRAVVYSMIFSLICGAATEFLVSDVTAVAVRAVIHYVVTLASFLGFFVFAPGKGTTETILTRGAIFTVLWAIPFAVWLVVRRVGEKRKKSGEEYRPVYKK